MEKQLAILLDPEKANLDMLPISDSCHPDYFFVGGSTGGDTTEFVKKLRLKIEDWKLKIPIILFPGNSSQFTPEADGILFLSLLSGKNPEYLVNQQIKSARRIYESHMDFVPTAYILIDGGVETSTMRVTQTQPLDPTDVDTIVDTCIAAHISIKLIVGGGIRTPEAMQSAYDAGADMVVIGNHFEDHPEELERFCRNVETSSARNLEDDEKFMRLAIEEARKALKKDEIPIGCVVVSQGQIIGRGHNLTETLEDVTAHAEMQAITAAAQTVGGKYLPRCM